MIAVAAFAAGVWAALVVLWVALCRAAGKERRRDERVDAELEAMANANRCDSKRTARPMIRSRSLASSPWPSTSPVLLRNTEPLPPLHRTSPTNGAVMSRATEPLDFLVGHEADPEVRRRAEAYVLGMPDATLQQLFVALPTFDAMVRREFLDRQKRRGEGDAETIAAASEESTARALGATT